MDMRPIREILGSEGDEDIYNCHVVTANYAGEEVGFYVFNHHRGDEKRFKATQDYLKGFADHRDRGPSEKKLINAFILWRDAHFASVHLSTAMTIHKSQGSSFNNVWVYPDIPKYPNRDNNKLAYVACSRAERMLNLCA